MESLTKKDTELKNIKDLRTVKVVDVLKEVRENHNELVDAFEFLNTKLNGLQTQLNALKEAQDIKGLRDSIDFNAETIKDVQEKVLPAIETKMNTNLTKVKADILVKVEENKEKIVTQEGHSRRRNVIINGVEELEGENTEEVATNFLKDELKIEAEDVAKFLFRDVHRLPKAKNADGTVNTKPRPIIIAFLQQKHRNATMRHAFNLKESGYSIKSDLPTKLNELRSLMLKERIRLKTVNPGVKYRVAERSYKPVFQKEDGFFPGSTTRIKWVNVKFPA